MTWWRRSTPPPPPIGVGITTLNRRKIALRSLRKIRRYTPPGVPIVVVDDGSDIPFPQADYRNPAPRGVANAKNHCLRLLRDYPGDPVEHFFLFDDDCHPQQYDWWRPYVESGEHHLAYLHANLSPAKHQVVYDDGHILAAERGTACMLYFSRTVIDQVGGFRPEFGRWSYEHDELSHRIMNAGLIRFPYQGLTHPPKIWNMDEHRHGESSMPIAERNHLRHGNKLLFETYRWSTDYVPLDPV